MTNHRKIFSQAANEEYRSSVRVPTSLSLVNIDILYIFIPFICNLVAKLVIDLVTLSDQLYQPHNQFNQPLKQLNQPLIQINQPLNQPLNCLNQPLIQLNQTLDQLLLINIINYFLFNSINYILN